MMRRLAKEEGYALRSWMAVAGALKVAGAGLARMMCTSRCPAAAALFWRSSTMSGWSHSAGFEEGYPSARVGDVPQ